MKYKIDNSSIEDIMCKQEGLHLDKNEVFDILKGDYAFVSVRGIGGKQMRFVDAMDKLPLLFFKKVLILVEFNEGCAPLFSEIDLLSRRFTPEQCSIGFSEIACNIYERHEGITLKMLYKI